MNSDSKLRNICASMIKSITKEKLHKSLFDMLNYITSNEQKNVTEYIFHEKHLLGNATMLIITSLFMIFLHFVNIL
jgi:hypothetical protein